MKRLLNLPEKTPPSPYLFLSVGDGHIIQVLTGKEIGGSLFFL
jgi:hypothetical protein